MHQDDGIKIIAERVRDAGGRALLVGGYVRDLMSNKSPKDCDLECFSITPDKLRSVLEELVFETKGTVDCVGESFKVFKVSWGKGENRIEFDVSIPRTEVKTGNGHKGFEVTGNPNATKQDAASR